MTINIMTWRRRRILSEALFVQINSVALDFCALVEFGSLTMHELYRQVLLRRQLSQCRKKLEESRQGFDEVTPLFDIMDTHNKNNMITQGARCQKIVNNELLRIVAVCGAVDSEIYEFGRKLRNDIEEWLRERTLYMGRALSPVHYEEREEENCQHFFCRKCFLNKIGD